MENFEEDHTLPEERESKVARQETPSRSDPEMTAFLKKLEEAGLGLEDIPQNEDRRQKLFEAMGIMNIVEQLRLMKKASAKTKRSPSRHHRKDRMKRSRSRSRDRRKQTKERTRSCSPISVVARTGAKRMKGDPNEKGNVAKAGKGNKTDAKARKGAEGKGAEFKGRAADPFQKGKGKGKPVAPGAAPCGKGKGVDAKAGGDCRKGNKGPGKNKTTASKRPSGLLNLSMISTASKTLRLWWANEKRSKGKFVARRRLRRGKKNGPRRVREASCFSSAMGKS
jgi:hypothetical protein